MCRSPLNKTLPSKCQIITIIIQKNASVKTSQAVSASRGSAEGDCRAYRIIKIRKPASNAFGGHGFGKNFYNGECHRQFEPPGFGDFPQQNSGRPALSGIQNFFP